MVMDLRFVRGCASECALYLEAWGGLDWAKAVWEVPGAGARFTIGGEPITEARLETIRGEGAEALPPTTRSAKKRRRMAGRTCFWSSIRAWDPSTINA